MFYLIVIKQVKFLRFLKFFIFFILNDVKLCFSLGAILCSYTRTNYILSIQKVKKYASGNTVVEAERGSGVRDRLDHRHAYVRDAFGEFMGHRRHAHRRQTFLRQARQI